MIGKLVQYTGWWGLLALIVATASLVVLALGCKSRVRPRMFLISLGLVCIATLFSSISLTVWFDTIRLDRADEINTVVAEREAKEAEENAEDPEAALASRVKFAEDSAEDRIRGGTNRIGAAAVPAWREGGPRIRGGGVATNQPATDAGGAADKLIGESETPVIYMKADKLAIVRIVERSGRLAIRTLMYLILLAIAWDYLTAFNLAENKRWPLPLSCAWVDSVSPKPRLLVIRPGLDEHWTPAKLLLRAVRKGEKVVYFGHQNLWADKQSLTRIPIPRFETLMVRIPRLGAFKLPLPVLDMWRIPILRYGGHRTPKGSEFVLDAAWFGRYVPVITDDTVCCRMMDDFVDILCERRRMSASSRRTLVVAWDRDEQLDDVRLKRLTMLASDVNLTVFIWSRSGKG